MGCILVNEKCDERMAELDGLIAAGRGEKAFGARDTRTEEEIQAAIAGRESRKEARARRIRETREEWKRGWALQRGRRAAYLLRTGKTEQYRIEFARPKKADREVRPT